MTVNALESQSHGSDVKVESSTTLTNAIQGGAPISPKPFETTDVEAEDMRNEWKAMQAQRNAEKKSSGKPDAGKRSEPKDQKAVKELEQKLASELNDDQSVGEVEEKEEANAKSDSETVEDKKETDKDSDKNKKTPIQKRMDRLFARTKEAEARSDKLQAELLEKEKQLDIFIKEYQHLTALAKEDPKDVQIRKLKYEKEMEEHKKTMADQIKTEKAKMLKDFQQKQQETLIIQESESLAEKYFTVSSEEILIRGARDVKKPLEQIAKEIHAERLKKAGILKVEEKKVAAPKTTANVGTSVKEIDFDDSADGWRAYLRSKGRDI